jgi:hypothetical protein
MGTALSTVTLEVAKILGNVRMGAATTTGSVEDLTDIDFVNPAEHYEGGTIWFIDGDNAGVTRRVEAYSEGNYTFDDLDNAVATGDRYFAMPAKYTRAMLIAGINAALSDTRVTSYDVSLETVANQESYDIPAGIKNIKKVEIATSTSSPYNYAENRSWYVMGGKLFFKTGGVPGTAGYIIRLWYFDSHDSVYDDDDEINDEINTEWLKWASVAYILRDIVSIQENDDAMDLELFNEALQKSMSLVFVIHSVEQQNLKRPPFLA